MDRIFHQRFTLASKCGIMIFTLLAFYFFWMRSTINACLGLIVMIVLVVMIERVIHTTYTLTSDGNLIISRGRFSRPLTIPVNEIIKVSVMNTSMKLSHFILVEYGAGHLTSVQPEDDEAFLEELKKCQQKIDKGL